MASHSELARRVMVEQAIRHGIEIVVCEEVESRPAVPRATPPSRAEVEEVARCVSRVQVTREPPAPPEITRRPPRGRAFSSELDEWSGRDREATACDLKTEFVMAPFN